MSRNYWSIDRSRPLEVFSGKNVLQICGTFTGEHPCRSVISIKVLCNFIEITLRLSCFPVNLLHISGHLFLWTPLEGYFYIDAILFFKGAIFNDLSNSIENPQCYEALKTKNVDVLDKHALWKTKLLKVNHKPHVSIKLRKEITKTSQLKNIANKTGKGIDLYKFRGSLMFIFNPQHHPCSIVRMAWLIWIREWARLDQKYCQ